MYASVNQRHLCRHGQGDVPTDPYSLVSYLSKYRHPQESLLKTYGMSLNQFFSAAQYQSIEGSSDSMISFSEYDRNRLVADLTGSSHDVAALVTSCQLLT